MKRRTSRNDRFRQERLSLPAPLSAVAVAFLPARDWMPGKTCSCGSEWQNPHDIVDFKTPFAQNCQGCHGYGEQIAGAISSILRPISPSYRNKRCTTSSPTVCSNRPDALFLRGQWRHADGKQIGILVDGIMVYGPITETPSTLRGCPCAMPMRGKLYDAYPAERRSAAGSDKMFRDGFLTNPAFLWSFHRPIPAHPYHHGPARNSASLTGAPSSPDACSAIRISPTSSPGFISQRKNEFGQPLPSGQQPEAP